MMNKSLIEAHPHDGRRIKKRVFKKHGYRDLLIKHKWGLRGGYASKIIKGNEIMQLITKEDSEFLHVIFVSKNNFYATAIRKEVYH
jgi:hypothetical protein